MNTPRRPTAWLMCVVAGAALLVLAIVLLAAFGTEHGAVRGTVVPVVNLGPVSDVPGPTPNGTPRTASATATPGAFSGSPMPNAPASSPRRLQLPRLGIDAPVVPVRAVDNQMQVPSDPRTLGWWGDGAVPGDASGDSVIVGHINYAGVRGALAVLPELHLGDDVLVAMTGADEAPQSRRFAVTAVRTYPKSTGLPPDLFRRTGPPQLVLITCGGPFDAATGNYEDNIVAYAAPV